MWARVRISSPSVAKNHDQRWSARGKKLGCFATFDFTNAQVLQISQFTEKMEFRAKAAKGRINVERERNKKAKINLLVLSLEICSILVLIRRGRTFVT